jgi:hypothetical protein
MESQNGNRWKAKMEIDGKPKWADDRLYLPIFWYGNTKVHPLFPQTVPHRGEFINLIHEICQNDLRHLILRYEGKSRPIRVSRLTCRTTNYAAVEFMECVLEGIGM